MVADGRGVVRLDPPQHRRDRPSDALGNTLLRTAARRRPCNFGPAGQPAMNKAIQHLWTPLATTPLLWLAVTLAAYVAARRAQRACNGSAFANPVLIATIAVGAIVLATGTSYRTYFAGAQFI